MSPKVRKGDAKFITLQPSQDYPIDAFIKQRRATKVYHYRRTLKGRDPIFVSLKTTKLSVAREKAEELDKAFLKSKAGDRRGLIQINELCDDLLSELKDLTTTPGPDGSPLRRESTYESKDLPYLRGSEHQAKDAEGKPQQRKRMRKQGVMRDLFGEIYVNEMTTAWWKSWIKLTGRKLGRNLNDIAKYLSLLLSFAVDKGYIPFKPELGLPEQYRKHKRKAVVFSDEQVLTFYAKANPTLQDLIEMVSENPFRPHEAYQMQWAMVQIKLGKSGEPFYSRKKGYHVVVDLPEWFVKKNARKLLLTQNAARVIIRRWRKNQALPPAERSLYVFPAPGEPKRPLGRRRLHHYWTQMKKAAGIPKDVKLNFGWFRHNVYRRLRKLHGLTDAEVSQVGGTSAATIKKHYDLEEEQAMLRVASAINLPFGQAHVGAAALEEEE